MVCSGLVALPHSSPLVSSRLLSSPPLGPSLEIDFLLSALSVPFSSPPAPSASVYILDAVKLHHRHSIPLAFFIFFFLNFFPPLPFFFFSILFHLSFPTLYHRLLRGRHTPSRFLFLLSTTLSSFHTSGYPPLSRYINVNSHPGNSTGATIPSLSSPINKTWLFQLPLCAVSIPPGPLGGPSWHPENPPLPIQEPRISRPSRLGDSRIRCDSDSSLSGGLSTERVFV